MRAADGIALDDGVGTGGAEAERPACVPHVAAGEAVHHRPLVQAEAAEVGRAGERGGQEVADEAHRGAAGLEEGPEVDDHRVADHPVVAPAGPVGVGGVREAYPGPRVPPAQTRGGVVVVPEQEVLDRVGAPARAPGPVAGRRGVDAFDVRLLASAPLRPAQLHLHRTTVPAGTPPPPRALGRERMEPVRPSPRPPEGAPCAVRPPCPSSSRCSPSRRAARGGDGSTASPPAPATSSAPADSATPPASASAAAGRAYLALGDSLAAGYQPGGTELRDSAYPALAAGRLSRGGAPLTVENLACSGETTGTFLAGGKCDFAAGSQVAQAETFLREHRGEVALVSVDIGGNDLLRCAARLQVDAACAAAGLGTVRKNLPTVVERLRAAAGPDVPVLVLGYYNPWLASSYLGAGKAQLAVATKAFTDLDAQIAAGAKKGGGRFVSLDAAFALDDTTPTTFNGRSVPTNVAQVCSLTYICTAFDIHLTDEGAAVVGRVLAEAATAAGVG